MMTGLPRFTIEERVLLHLYEERWHGDKWEAPPTLTQQGIGRAIGVHRAAAARALLALKPKNLVQEETKHVHRPQ